MSNTEAALVTGYDPSRISILKGDPSFQALLADYRTLADGAQADFFARSSMLSISVVNRLQDIVDDDEDLSPSTLLEIGKFSADRSGNAPVTKNLNVNVNHQFGDKLKAARERAAQAALSAPVIDAEFSEVPDEPGG